MKKNMGNPDRMIRILAAVVIAILYFGKLVTGTAAILLGLLAIAFIVTSLVGFCPFYRPFRISTNKKS